MDCATVCTSSGCHHQKSGNTHAGNYQGKFKDWPFSIPFNTAIVSIKFLSVKLNVKHLPSLKIHQTISMFKCKIIKVILL